MIGNLDTVILQHLWWLICSLIGSLFLFLTFVQGGQTLLWQVAKNDIERSLVLNSLGRKWELTFTTLVLFGGSLFAAFPKLYATSFGGAYWVWMLILFTFVLQAVSYEFRTKPANLLGETAYEGFLFLNGSLGILLIGAAVGTFFTGSNFQLSEYNFVTWQHQLRGLEAAFSLFNLSMGLFLVFNARTIGAMYLVNNVDFSGVAELEIRLRKACLSSFLCSLPFLLYILGSFVLMTGYGIDENQVVSMVEWKYYLNMLASPWIAVLLLGGLLLVITGMLVTAKTNKTFGIWAGGTGTALVGLAIFSLVGFNNTPFYPSKIDLQSSLTIFNASSSHYTLTIMSYVAFAIPVVLAYVIYVWRAMNKTKITIIELDDEAY